MKTLHLSIITIVGIVVIAMATLGVFLEKINDNPYNAINTSDGQKPGSLSEKNCGQFYTVPTDNHFLDIYPVLVVPQNSTACAKLTHTINYMYNDNRSRAVWPQMLNFGERLHIGKYNYVSHGDEFSMSAGKDYTSSFQIVAMPETIDLAKYPVGSQFTVTMVIHTLSNATGFYDSSIEEVPCDSYPLAVGYSLDQVNSLNFSQGMGTMHNHSCFNGPYLISSVQVSGMDFKLIKFQ